jgi:voltage-gated potassium channel Kch
MRSSSLPRSDRRWLPVLLAALAALLPTGARAAAASASTACNAPGSGAQLLLSAGVLVISCLWQLAITTAVSELNHSPKVVQWCTPQLPRRSLVTLVGAGFTSLGLVGDILIWSLVLQGLGLFPSLKASFYFTAMTFTTVGYGDVVLPECWHLLSVAVAITGLMMSGWSTALLVFVVQHTMEMRFNSQKRR